MKENKDVSTVRRVHEQNAALLKPGQVVDSTSNNSNTSNANNGPLVRSVVHERPILFSGPMICAILDGRKTQTRRVVKKALGYKSEGPAGAVHPASESGWIAWWPGGVTAEQTKQRYKHGFPCPYGIPGDRLWVRETWAVMAGYREDPDMIGYKADDSVSFWDGSDLKPYPEKWSVLSDPTERWHPSIHMPRAYSRILLEVTGVRVERVQDITEADAKAEGCEPWAFGPEQCMTSGERGADKPYRGGYAVLWDDINADRGYSWYINPWVWVIEFKRLEAPNY